jgi:radical SAM protein with 4Fe4S-binding SPASM domain
MPEMNDTSTFSPLVAVWEITMNCNMRCKHCGSSCTGPLPDELTTQEAFEVCDSLGRLGLQNITLSGGEPFTRKDWHLIVERLTKNNITTNILSNGWFIDRDMVKKAAGAGLVNVGISLDGVEETHDLIRKKGSFSRIMKALDVLRQEKMPVGISTSIHRGNIDELPQIKEIIIDKGVQAWQLQATIPMGNLLEHPDWILEPKCVDTIIDFAYESMREGRIRVHLSDDIGYFNLKEIEIKKSTQESEFFTGIWNSCPAGKIAVGIRCNGDILGCLSIRDDSYIEGNVRDLSLEEIWNRPGAFAWNRELTKDKLTGFCQICQYGSYCLAGCTSSKQSRGNVVTENKFCSYWVAVDKERETAAGIDDLNLLTAKGGELAKEGDYQCAEVYVSRALELSPGNTELLNLLGYIHFGMENYPQCEACNRSALKIETGSAYSMKGLGLALARQGRVDEGIEMLKKAIKHTTDDFMDPYHDLAVTLVENGRPDEALEILEQGRKRSPAFKESSEKFHQQLRQSLS